MSDEAIIRIKLDTSEMAKAGEGGGEPGGSQAKQGGQAGVPARERRTGEGSTGDPQGDKFATMGDIEALIKRQGKESAERVEERKALDRTVAKASAGDPEALRALQSEHGMSAASVASKLSGYRKDIAATQEASHVQQGKAVAQAASGNLGPIASIAKGKVKEAIGSTEAGSAALGMLGKAGAAAGIGVAATYGMMYGSMIGSEVGTALTGIKGARGEVTGDIQSIIGTVKRLINTPLEIFKGYKAATYFGQSADAMSRGTAKRLGVAQALDREDAEMEEEEFRMMVRGAIKDPALVTEMAKAVWDATSAGAGELLSVAGSVIKKLAFG